MAEAKAQKARKALVSIVSSYDPKTVRKTAVENSTEFRDFLAKSLESDGLDSLDVMDIMTELEEALEVNIPDTHFRTWQDAFDKILLLLNEE